MARIYKESRYVLQLLIGKSYVAQYKDIKISFYTKNPSNQVMVDNGITIKRNIAEVMVESTLFDNLEEGLISYIVYGTKDGIPFIEERQSNYFLKAPLDFKPTTCILEDKSVTPSMGERNVDGYIIVEEGEGYDGLSRVVIDPQTLYNEGVEAGYGQGKTDGVNEQKSKLESINITQNGTYTKEDGYNQIEVNVMPKINVKDTGLRFGNSTFTEVPEWADFNGVIDMYGMFQYCSNLQTIPLIDTSNVTSMANMFSYCNHLQTIPLLNTSNVSNMDSMFFYCEDLQTIPLLNTSNVINMNNMFYGCSNLQTIPSLDTSKVGNMNKMFNNCRSLVSIPALNAQRLSIGQFYGIFGDSELPNLINFGGFLNLKCSLTNEKNLKKLPNLTYESCINVLNGLYDFTGNGETPYSGQGQLKVHQNFLDKVGEEISIGVAKGWTITV